ncbi:MAG: hypothetical protein IPL28_08060 [Chloroflexi bacterium]|nr:hypothetical protein [Chloroflexota bacterium]
MTPRNGRVDYLAQHASLQGDERVTLFRFWLARDGYQAVSPAQSRLFLNMVQHYLTTPRLAFSFVPCADPDFWALGFAFADLQRLAGADFVIDGRSFGVYGHDWRVTPPLEWLALLAKRQLGQAIDISPAPIPPPTPPLSEEEFATAVREALRHYTDVVALGQIGCGTAVCWRVCPRTARGGIAKAVIGNGRPPASQPPPTQGVPCPHPHLFSARRHARTSGRTARYAL